MSKLTQRDRDNLADIVWYIKGQLDLHKLNDDWDMPFNRGHVKSLEIAMNQNGSNSIDKSLQTLPNHWVLDPIVSIEELSDEAKQSRSVYHHNWGIKPAAVILNMQGSALNRLFEGNYSKLYKLEKK